MTIIEAIQSKKKFKRQCYQSWHQNVTGTGSLCLNYEDVLASDWETRPNKTVMISRDVLYAAFTELLGPPVDNEDTEQFDKLCEHLGL